MIGCLWINFIIRALDDAHTSRSLPPWSRRPEQEIDGSPPVVSAAEEFVYLLGKKERKMLRICNFCHFSNIPQRAEQKYWTLPAGIHPTHWRWCSVEWNRTDMNHVKMYSQVPPVGLGGFRSPRWDLCINSNNQTSKWNWFIFLWFRVFGARSRVGASHPLRLRSFGSHAGGGSVPIRFIFLKKKFFLPSDEHLIWFRFFKKYQIENSF